MRWMLALRARLRLLLPATAEARMEDEMRFHLEMETEKLVREGLSPAEARRRARVAFGGVEGHKEAMRDGRTLAWLGGLSLDLRLGMRMMRKHPALTLVGGLGMAVAVAIGAGVFGFIAAMVDPSPPLSEGERIVSLVHATDEPGDPHRRMLHDFLEWRGELRAVQELGAFRGVPRNLVTGDGPPETLEVAEITASGFRVARVPPLLGRPLVAADEAPGAPDVAVIGHDLWQRRFGGDRGVVGRAVQLGDTRPVVVGVMPAGFAFPVKHQVWTPLRLDPSRYERGRGPSLYVFGRLAPGASLAEARAELEGVGQRTAAAHPEVYARLRPQVMPYTFVFAGAESPQVAWLFQLMRIMASLLVVVVAVNVAILVYARTAMRMDEIAVRTALGASRRRIVTQLFVEALVLSALAAAAGLAVGAGALRWIQAYAGRTGAEFPFWFRVGLSPGMVAYALGLAVVGAVIVGVGPGLQATGRRVQTHLQALSSGGSGMRLGRTWMVLVVTQVALAVAVLPPALFHAGRWTERGLADPGAGLESFLTATVEGEMLPPSGAGPEADERAFQARYAARHAELVRRLEAEPGVADVVVTSGTPGEGWESQVELASAGTGAVEPGAARHPVAVSYVGGDFFGAFGVRLLTGRTFAPGDEGEAATAVVVNQSFVGEVLGGGNALGRRIRYPAGFGEGEEPGRWLEIVGVVSDFPVTPPDAEMSPARLYQPVRLEASYPLSVTLRVEGREAAAFAGRLREVTAAVDPTLQLDELQPLAEILREEQSGMRMAAVAVGVVTLSVLLLSAAGIYALMSFAVTRRRKEIGIRSALGAHPGRLLRSVFARAGRQLALGAAVGLGLAVALDRLTGGELMGGRGAVILPAVVLLMGAVGLLAALEPARRALRIAPMEALRTDG